MKTLVVGAGIFGCNCAIEFAKAGFRVDLIESDSDIMMQASKNNHNRIHLGYHYLRSKQTAQQSLEGLLSFLFYYGDSVIHSFPNYYAIAKEGSLTSVDEFIDFCDTIGIDYDEEFPSSEIINHEKIDNCFKVPEPVFDYTSLKRSIWKRIQESAINLKLNTTLLDLSFNPDTKIYTATTAEGIKEYDAVINVTYSQLNKVNEMVGAEKRLMKFQDVVIPNFYYEHEPIGLTIMDGPFCSVMPAGKLENQFLLYHVKNSVQGSKVTLDYSELKIQEGNLHDEIYRRSIEYYPFLKKAQHIGNYRTVRAVHENQEDARVTELQTYDDLPNYFSILSGKMSTCVQVALSIKHTLQNKNKIKEKII